MKKIIIILIILGIIGVGGWYGYKALSTPKDPFNWTEPFMWGVTAKPSAVRKYHISIWNQQMKLVNDLGAKWIRLGYNNEASFDLFDEMVDAANDKGINVLMNIESQGDVLKLKDPYYDGYTTAYQIVSHYKDKINYYQLLSEAASTALKGPEYNGESESDYDEDSYEQVKEWLRGASKGIRKADSNAKIMITDQWTHFAFFDMIARDNIDYDVLGWDWFSDMGLMEEKQVNGMTVLEKLKTYNKPIILAEVNQRFDEDGMDEDAQSDFINKMAKFAWKNRDYIKGFYVLELVDLAPKMTEHGGAEYYGLVKFEMGKDGGYILGDSREAFNTYKKVIKKYSE